MDDMLDELQITAERVERFRAIHEEAVRDLRTKIAEARASGYTHDEIDGRIREARDSVRRFTRMRRATDFLESASERVGTPDDRGQDPVEVLSAATGNGASAP